MDNRPVVWVFVSYHPNVWYLLNSIRLESCSCPRRNRRGFCNCLNVDAVEGMVRSLLAVFSPILAILMNLFIIQFRPWVRKVGQLWYEIFQFSANKSPEELMESIEYGDDHQLVMCMHPHGIVPYHAGLWAAYADQYMSDPATGRALYGFGAAADAVGYVPGLRNIMGWLSAGSASYKVLKAGITKVLISFMFDLA